MEKDGIAAVFGDVPFARKGRDLAQEVQPSRIGLGPEIAQDVAVLRG